MHGPARMQRKGGQADDSQPDHVQLRRQARIDDVFGHAETRDGKQQNHDKHGPGGITVDFDHHAHEMKFSRLVRCHKRGMVNDKL